MGLNPQKQSEKNSLIVDSCVSLWIKKEGCSITGKTVQRERIRLSDIAIDKQKQTKSVNLIGRKHAQASPCKEKKRKTNNPRDKQLNRQTEGYREPQIDSEKQAEAGPCQEKTEKERNKQFK